MIAIDGTTKDAERLPLPLPLTLTLIFLQSEKEEAEAVPRVFMAPVMIFVVKKFRSHVTTARMNIPTTDLTQRPPRSVRMRLGGYALLPRMLDKCRAELAGTAGSFHYACPNDQRILSFLGIDADALRTEVATGKGDGEILAWITVHQRNRHVPEEIEAWSDAMDKRTPTAEDREKFEQYLAECGPNRKDITRWPDLLDLDDFVSYGGKA